MSQSKPIEELIPIKLKSGLGYEITIGLELDDLIINEIGRASCRERV